MFKIDEHFFLAENILSGQRIRLQKFIIRTIEHHFTTEISGAWSDLYDPVRCFDEFFIMFYDDDSVAHFSQFLDSRYRSDDFLIIESDGRFVKHVNDSSQFVS